MRKRRSRNECITDEPVKKTKHSAINTHKTIYKYPIPEKSQAVECGEVIY